MTAFFLIIVITMLVLFALYAKRSKSDFPKSLIMQHSPIKIGHRGASGYCPENTMASYKKAIELGADFLEVDIHLSKDDVLVVHHDPTLDRTTNGKGNLRDYTAAELKELDAGSWYHSRYKNERIPLLREVLENFGSEVGILIELKHPSAYPGIEEKLAEELGEFQECSTSKNKIMVHSFDMESMKRFHQLMPDIQVGVLIKRRINDQKLREIAEFASFLNPKQTILSTKLQMRIQKHGMKVFTWTVNNKKQIHMFKMMQVDGIISDFPDYFLD
ncbi:glycerophosphodiester phosphodiesterase [Peribacillus frigoritolerans]|uniref:glycerophosphodiester phosphodiesterase n=1 Tax=Peribacillus frigoritolerans TaxID=450367 RepID=UPI002B2511AF|nr:glycerophosphodiester phosphodiesterase family protein [Peribacillus frigoritolerans]MEB2630849.1 glycerophosphodiester phosphodiesterase family protein [Peribacillus frigoritolerans]